MKFIYLGDGIADFRTKFFFVDWLCEDRYVLIVPWTIRMKNTLFWKQA
jgi:hypothetical protein